MSEALKKYRTFWRRLGAGIIDGLVFLPLLLIEVWFVEDLESSVESTILFTALNALIIFTYSIWMTQRFGQTIGKMVTGIIILDEETETHPVSTMNAICRDLPLIIAEFLAILYMIITMDISEKSIAMQVLNFASGVWVLAELISMFQNERRRAIHDIFARSVVVRLDSKRLVNEVS